MLLVIPTQPAMAITDRLTSRVLTWVCSREFVSPAVTHARVTIMAIAARIATARSGI